MSLPLCKEQWTQHFHCNIWAHTIKDRHTVEMLSSCYQKLVHPEQYELIGDAHVLIFTGMEITVDTLVQDYACLWRYSRSCLPDNINTLGVNTADAVTTTCFRAEITFSRPPTDKITPVATHSSCFTLFSPLPLLGEHSNNTRATLAFVTTSRFLRLCRYGQMYAELADHRSLWGDVVVCRWDAPSWYSPL